MKDIPENPLADVTDEDETLSVVRGRVAVEVEGLVVVVVVVVVLAKTMVAALLLLLLPVGHEAPYWPQGWSKAKNSCRSRGWIGS